MYTIDTVDPTITITAPTKKKKDNITDTTITVTDLVEIHPAGIEIDSDPVGITDNLVCTPDAGDKNIIYCTVTVKESGNITVKATDKAGNSITKSEAGYIIDRIAPKVFITSTTPINKANRAHYILEGTCTAGDSGIVTIIAEQPYMTECLSSGTWSTELDLSSQPDGTVSVYASQTDDVGNKGEHTKELLKDTIPPIVGYENISTNILSPELTDTINDSAATVTVKLYKLAK